MNDKITELEQRRDTMIAYARMKLSQGDWHGLSDASNDLREIEIEIAVRKELLISANTDALTTQLKD